jgi:phosphatidylglycerol:prolipoprotein diacylglycerol transferase
MLAIACIVGTFLAQAQAKKDHIGTDIVFNFTFLSVLSGIVGARILYIVEHIPLYRDNPLEMLMLSHGGLSWFGGLIAGGLCAVVYIKRKNLPVLLFLDMIAPFVALGQAIGRVGCFLNGCCQGIESSFGVYFPEYHAVLVPTQIYSSFLLLGIFVVLRLMQDRPHPRGMIFYGYLLLYSLKRFFIEFWRADNPKIYAGLSLFQILSIGLFISAVCGLFVIRAKKER